MLAIVTIYSLRFLQGYVAKPYESCRNFVDVADVLEVKADGFLRLLAGCQRPPNGAKRGYDLYLAKRVHKM